MVGWLVGCLLAWLLGWLLVCMYACMHGWMHVCMYVCVYVCIYVCMYVCWDDTEKLLLESRVSDCLLIICPRSRSNTLGLGLRIERSSARTPWYSVLKQGTQRPEGQKGTTGEVTARNLKSQPSSVELMRLAVRHLWDVGRRILAPARIPGRHSLQRQKEGPGC